MSDPQHFPFQRRSRTCSPDCTVGYIEDRPCAVPPCPLVCPIYYVDDFESDETDKNNDLRVKLSFHMDVGKVPFGKLILQEVDLERSDGEKVAKLAWPVGPNDRGRPERGLPPQR